MRVYRVGDRVRFIHRVDHFGVVVSVPYRSPVDGGPRQDVMWADTNEVNGWDPVFLMPEESTIADDPDVVYSGVYISRKRTRVTTNYKGHMVILHQGLNQIKRVQRTQGKRRNW